MNFDSLADRYTRHTGTLRGIVRHTLVARQMANHLPPPPARIVDVGGGAGAQAIPLARQGYGVTLLDPSEEMLRRAHEALQGESPAIRDRVRLVRGTGEDACRVLGEERFDAVLCHGVTMYVDDPEPLVHALISLTRRGGTISLLTKNQEALAMRPALEGRYRDALSALEADRDTGGMGVPTRAHPLGQLMDWLREGGTEVVRWYGVRVFTDHLGHQEAGPDVEEVLELEWQAGQRDPYRRVARLIHVIGVRREG